VPGSLQILGVRHHSPACARRVRDAILTLKPRYVLIEGPADMNGRLDELALSHRLPVAIFSYLTHGDTRRASWSPFCDYSPEWVALAAAREVGAEARFIDLPAWAPALGDARNRYADRRVGAATEALCRAVGVDDGDALWDHLFEQPVGPAELDARLSLYFDEIRGGDPPDDADAPREAFMADGVRYALSRAAAHEVVAVVCGGYHGPWLAREAKSGAAPPDDWPAAPAPPEGARAGSFLVPFNFHRLDSFTGYQAGMPSPAWYQAVWEAGHEAAPERLLAAAVARLRGRRLPVSPADVVAAWTLARGLARLRGHTVMTRTDLLDGMAGALIKEPLEVRLPWSRRGPLPAGSDPTLVEIVAAFSGDRVGKLAPGTPQPPLVEDVALALDAHGLVPGRKARSVTLRLDEGQGLAASRVLHRLRILRIPGFTRAAGPAWATQGPIEESWRLSRAAGASAALIEAGAWGATLGSACAARLERALAEAGGRLDDMAALLSDATFAGALTLLDRALGAIAAGAGAEPRLEVLGAALARLLGLWRHDRLLGAAGSATLGGVIAAAWERGLWLFEGFGGAAGREHLRAVIALRDALRLAGPRLGLSSAAATGAARRRSRAVGAPPGLRGAALGLLWSTGSFARPQDARAAALDGLGAAGRGQEVGDYLAGLFALAREEVVADPALVGAVDARICDLARDDFLVALPALRLAFSWFPPREKQSIARAVMDLGALEDPREVLSLEHAPDVLAAGAALDARVEATGARFGLLEVAP